MSTILGRVANGVKKTFVVLYTSTLAKNSVFDPTGTSLSSINAEDAIKEVDGKVDRGSVSVTSDGVKSRRQLQYELFQLIDSSKINKHSLLSLNNIYYQFYRVKDGNYYFTSAYPHSDGPTIEQAILSGTLNDNTFTRSRGSSYGDYSTEVPYGNSFVLELFY